MTAGSTASSRAATVTLPADDQIRITREFDAPAELVFKAWTTPELVRKWWHANRGVIDSIEIDLRVGGAWRYVMHTPTGFEVAFHGEYREIVPNERLVHSEVYEAAPDAEALSTMTFTERDGRTHVEMLIQHASQASRDAHINSGMEDGLQDALDMLEQAAQALAA